MHAVLPLAVRAAVRPSRSLSAARELLLLGVLYGAYSLSRTLVDSGPGEAMETARQVLEAERWLGMDVESRLVAWLVTSPLLSVVAGYAYAALHYTVTPTVLVWLYRSRPDRYRQARTVLVLATVVALVCYWLVPTAPPRLLSGDYPDVLALTSQWGWWGTEASAPRGLGSLTNQYAALPSMHVGWAVWCGLVVALLARSRWARAVGLAYPVLVCLVVVATGNHWVLDAVAGAGVVVLAGLVTVGATASRSTAGRAPDRTTGAGLLTSTGTDRPAALAGRLHRP
jgi:hypothetical protein